MIGPNEVSVFELLVDCQPGREIIETYILWPARPVVRATYRAINRTWAIFVTYLACTRENFKVRVRPASKFILEYAPRDFLVELATNAESYADMCKFTKRALEQENVAHMLEYFKCSGVLEHPGNICAKILFHVGSAECKCSRASNICARHVAKHHADKLYDLFDDQKIIFSGTPGKIFYDCMESLSGRYFIPARNYYSGIAAHEMSFAVSRARNWCACESPEEHSWLMFVAHRVNINYACLYFGDAQAITIIQHSHRAYYLIPHALAFRPRLLAEYLRAVIETKKSFQEILSHLSSIGAQPSLETLEVFEAALPPSDHRKLAKHIFKILPLTLTQVKFYIDRYRLTRESPEIYSISRDDYVELFGREVAAAEPIDPFGCPLKALRLFLAAGQRILAGVVFHHDREHNLCVIRKLLCSLADDAGTQVDAHIVMCYLEKLIR